MQHDELRRLIRNNTLEINQHQSELPFDDSVMARDQIAQAKRARINKLTEQNAAAQAELDALSDKFHNVRKVEADDYELDEEAQEVERNRIKRYGGSKRRARRSRRAGRSRRARRSRRSRK